MTKNVDETVRKSLITQGILSEDAVAAAQQEARVEKAPLTSILLRKGVVSKKTLLAIAAKEYGYEGVDLKHTRISKDAVAKVPTRLAYYYKIMPVHLKGGVLTVAVSLPLSVKTQDEICTHLGCAIETVFAFEEDIIECMKRYYGLGADTLEAIDKTSLASAGAGQKEQEIEDIGQLAEDASVARLVNQIIYDAYKKRATDIHIEPSRGDVSIRYRTDGVLYETTVPPEIKQFIPAIISRIKIMCNLNIVERRMPQDGRAAVKTQDQTLDLRISTLPTPYGESVVIRLLPTKMLFNLERLGLSSQDLLLMEDLITRPYGIIFITGPTGSGKTTTLYAALNKLNTRDRKIITIEDPIEYELKGVTQIQIVPDIGLTFAMGLRSILRHDPDIIMVGEVRDIETAEIAIRVALTGHLVFSTLHTKDAPSGIARLVDIGIEPYLVASSIEAFIAQRLVRVLCPRCKEEDFDIAPEFRQRIAKEHGVSSAPAQEVRIYKGKGCDNCNGTGFAGRTGIYEVLRMDEAIRDLVMRRASSEDIKRAALKRGIHSLQYDGYRKVAAGITTPAEVMRVVSNERDEAAGPADSSSQNGSGSVFLETRMYPRLDTEVVVRYRVITSKDELSRRGFSWDTSTLSKDISAGGIAFSAKDPVSAGAFLEVQIELPDGNDAITCLAKVAWVKEKGIPGSYDVGICFLDLTGSERSRLKDFVVREQP